MAGLLLAGTSFAGGTGGGDTCSLADPISGEGAFAFDTTGSDNSGFASAPCITAINHDQFYQWTALADGDYDFDLCASTVSDTILGVYAGVGCAATCVDSNDDSCSLRSKVSVAGILTGDTFLIRVGSYSSGASGEGAGILTIGLQTPPPAPPANDDCSGATVLTGLGDFAFDSTAATGSGFTGDGGGTSANLQDVFFSWTAPGSGDFTVQTLDSVLSYDTKMTIYAGDCVTAAWLGYDDDGGDTYASLLNLTGVTGGDQFLIQVGTYSGSTTPGPNVLNISQAPDGSDCSLALPVSGLGGFAYDTTGHVSTGFAGAGGLCSAPNQDYFFAWTATQDGDYNFDTFLTGYDTIMSVYSGGDCSATCIDSNDDFGGLQSQVTVSGVITGDVLLVQVGGYNTNEGPGTLTVSFAVDPCAVADDGFEDNDDCTTATVLTAGSYTGLHVDLADPDFYEVSIPAGYVMTLTETFDSNETDYNLYDTGCANLLISGDSNGFAVTNTGAVAASVVIEAHNWSGASLPCGDYDFDLAVDPDPCGPGNDDSLEDNDDCASATPMVDGTTTGLFVSKTDKDFYSFCVADGATVTIDILFTNANGDIDGFLRAASSASCGLGNGADELTDGFSSTDNENLTWTNTTGASLDVVLEVNVYTNSASNCNTYDLMISGSGGCGIGTVYCVANANSTGFVSTIAATGSDVAADNNFTLVSTNLPDGEFMYFIGSYGQDQVNNPGGSEGNLCVGGGLAIARFLPTLGAIAGGMHSGMIDLTNIPLNTGSVEMILAGDTFNFQGWHRETSTGSSNFTPGLEVTFQ
ncbi:MAG: hypothetical protein H6830_11645 [Planctomycetes bacterium]|nr:hypothetical protein [Planctomycetota bacterium]MCB9908829.1 hypothetical protein [Planctomycetota bacterium]